MSPKKLLFGLASAAFVLAVSSPSQAQVCASNADCRAGTTCQVSAVAPTPTSGPSCGREVDCGGTGAGGSSNFVAPAADAGTGTPAPAQMSCQAAPCQVNSDCGGGAMVCHSQTSSTCSGGTAIAPCQAGTKCDLPAKPVPPDMCTTTTVSACAFKWQLPCNADADCGSDTFTCVPVTSGSCSGSGGGSGPGTGAADLVAPKAPLPSADGGTANDPPTCTTTTSFPGYCQPKATTCATDADCPAAWTCVDVSAPSGATTSSSSGGGSTGIVAVDVGGGGAPVPRTVKACQSPAAFPAPGGVATDTAGDPKGGQQPTTSGPGGGATSGENSGHAADGAGCAVAAVGVGDASAWGLGALAMLATVTVLTRGRARRRRS